MVWLVVSGHLEHALRSALLFVDPVLAQKVQISLDGIKRVEFDLIREVSVCMLAWEKSNNVPKQSNYCGIMLY